MNQAATLEDAPMGKATQGSGREAFGSRAAGEGSVPVTRSKKKAQASGVIPNTGP
ncbi:hypothetical protein GCM10010191_00150 [Actinomadura vinacea]|uniref:Uncharacterized protein n=1 Tax=Actinomadura vinacea TaxID=115336 RepID=A0ABN3I8F8_9ACTN